MLPCKHGDIEAERDEGTDSSQGFLFGALFPVLRREIEDNAKYLALLKTGSRECQRNTYCGLVFLHTLVLILMTWMFL